MRVVAGRNVNQLYPQIIGMIRREGERQDSRNGGVAVFDSPFCAVYERPDEMVLLDPDRNANPAFHLMECLWHLGGRADAAFLDNYVSDFGKRFANERGNLDGAYGVRWRSHFADYSGIPLRDDQPPPLDQLDDVVAKLKKNPLDRRVVIQMWDPSLDNDPNTKDACCNQQLMPRIVGGRLDLTVTCRSNDAVWGALGANCVHFPFLQLYLAGRIGVPVGKFYQFSNNYHLYDWVVDKIGTPRPGNLDPYTRGEVAPSPIGTNWDRWDDDLKVFLNWHDQLWGDTSGGVLQINESESGVVWTPTFDNGFFGATAVPMALAFWFHRRGRPQEAYEEARKIGASDWRAGALLWLDRAGARRSPGDVRQG